jgi:AraC-like DNA-binding protein
VVALALDVRYIPGDLRADAWMKGVVKLFPGVEFVHPPAAPFNASAYGFQLGQAQLWRIMSPGQVLNIRSGAVGDIDETVSVVLQLRGSLLLRRSGAVHRVSSGTLYFADPREPLEVEFPERCEQIILHVPRRLALDRHPHLRGMRGQIDQQDPGVVLLKAALVMTAKTAPRLSILQGSVALASILQLIGAPQISHACSNSNSWRTRRALADIECSFSDPKLNAERVALNQKISRRRLDAIFIEETGKSLTAQIWERRLLQAAQDLLDQSKSGQQIAEVAFALGFEQAAHFCRAFKKRFHLTPSEWRNQAASPD